MSQSSSLTRRRLIGAAAGLAIASPAASAVDASAHPDHARMRASANDMVVLGLIGCGGMGAVDMRNLMEKSGVRVAAVCDVDDARMGADIASVEQKYGKRPAVYKDYRRMLERKDIDAVIIGTPDYWHALNLIHACQAGKDAYCEKPISHSIVEAKAMVAAARRHNRIVQVGTWQRSTPEFVSAIDYVRSGRAGKIVTCRAWRTDPSQMGRHAPAPVPHGFDYQMWVGPSAYTPYIPQYTHGNWRWFMNRGCGMTGDWGVHMMDICLLGMSPNTDLPMPTEVASFGGKLAWPDDDRTAPDTQLSIMQFHNPDFVMKWETGRDHIGEDGAGAQFVAADGKSVTVWRGGWQVRDADGAELPKQAAPPPPTDHWQNWLDCVRSREQPRSNIYSMAQTTIVCHLCNAAQLSGETVRWDPDRVDIVGSAGRSTTSYFRPYRKPWTLPA